MRTSRPSGHPLPLPARRSSSRPSLSGRRTVAVVLALAVTLAACGRGDVVEVPAAPEPEPGEAIEVIGRAGLVFHDVSPSGTLVFPEGDDRDLPVVGDEAAIQAAAAAIRTWLDGVLSERNRGVTTTVATSDVDADAFARALGVDGPSTAGVLDVQVASATYLIEVAYLGGPGWALVRVESLLVDVGAPTVEIGRRLDSFVFSIDETGAVEFLALEVAP